MRQGGNGQIREFFDSLQIGNSPVQTLYRTKGASHYREKLKERVDKIMSGEIKSETHILESNNPSITNLKENQSIEVSKSKSSSIRVFNITFGSGPLGLTLTKVKFCTSYLTTKYMYFLLVDDC
jgi:hypothetical protein